MAPTQQQAKQARAKVLSTGKQPKASIQRYLKSTEAQLVEKEAKSVLLLRGIRCSDAMTTVLRDMRSMNAPNAKLLNKNNQIVPFDDEGQLSLEFLTTKNDCSLFAIASSNKKRPNNLVMGRTFDHQVLDMVELGILRYKSMNDYAGMPKKRVGSKPMMLFVGDAWHLDTECKKLQNLLLDFYRGDPVEKLVLSGLDHAMVFTAVADAPPLQQPGLDNATTLLIHQRTYYCKLKKNTTGGSGSAPLPYLTPSGPDMDFRIRRTKYASPEMWKLSLKQPESIKPKKKKNQSTNIFGETIGRLHLEKQDIDKRQGRKSKALRLADKISTEEEKAAIESELDMEGQEIGKEFKQTYGFEKDQE
uniref:Ribosome production factor 2 homolog n=1 Tax=Ditylum brightwellii TaxID=49249 RepID=A0A6U3STN6_9STRA|mmetsp:Transcript_3421/g.4630  ORF Transcript_3421/g.4630 Transcript_3421/m.4630 type:complete len:360 (+) Transcript_3421:73-1152(+)